MIEKWVYNFSRDNAEGNAQMKDILGGKGAGLAAMCNIGLNVPPGCTIISQFCNYFFQNNHQLPNFIKKEIKKSINLMEIVTGKKFGDLHNPLLLSIRSGSRYSMPGMMDTILNLGLNDETVEALAKKSNNPRFAYDSYRRFIQMYANVVMDVDHHHFEEILDIAKQKNNILNDVDLTTDLLKYIIKLYKLEIIKLTSTEFPNNIEDQLWNSISSVFKSWQNPRAQIYRKIHSISEDLGTAVNIQSMVFGNLSFNSATGVAFTRDPSNGNKKFYGEYLINAQGEDVVAGIRTPNFITKEARLLNKSKEFSMEESMNSLYLELRDIATKLEEYYGDMQDIEFTIEENKLWILQTRSGKRTIKSAIKIAVDMVSENIISKSDALSRIDPKSLDQLLHPSIDPNYKYESVASGLAASPGAASGIIVFSAKEAEEETKNKRKVILVRIETSPEDIGGMYAAEGILTSRGGMTSHAAVVARGMGKPCVCGAMDIIIDYKAKTITTKNAVFNEGDIITINGSTGEIIKGAVPTIYPELSAHFKTLLSWTDELTHTKVRANAETLVDAQTALKFGANGIGLCRTEHMFFQDDRISLFRQMIISADAASRSVSLIKLLAIQQSDFEEIFRIMDNLPVNIRLLDPPLHEFLPHKLDEIELIAKELNLSVEAVSRRIDELSEQNPMLGHRGCRLGISNPEIYKMQVEAIFNAAITVSRDDIRPKLEIMIPFIISEKELIIFREMINHIADKLQLSKYNIDYQIGSMIELPKAALMAGKIANYADFFSFGTNDLTQTTLGISRDDSASFFQTYKDKNIMSCDPFVELDCESVGELISIAIERARKAKNNIKLGVCGEHAGDSNSIRFLSQFNLDYISCSPYRIAIARLCVAQNSIMNQI